MEESTDIARKYTHRCDRSKIPCMSLWRQGGFGASAGADASRGRVKSMILYEAASRGTVKRRLMCKP